MSLQKLLLFFTQNICVGWSVRPLTKIDVSKERCISQPAVECRSISRSSGKISGYLRLKGKATAIYTVYTSGRNGTELMRAENRSGIDMSSNG